MSEGSKGVSTRIMTYAEIEEALSLKPASARQLVRRQGWRRIPGNDGRTRIEIPFEEFERALKRGVEAPVDAEETETDAPVESAVESPLEGALVTALTSHIERLERALADSETALSAATAERDTERAAAVAAREEALIARGALDVARVQLEAERERTAAADQRAEEVAADRDRWHAAATARRPWWRRLAG